MAEEAARELPENIPGPVEEAACEDMELVAAAGSPEDGAAATEPDGVGNGKRSREEDGGEDEEEEGEPKKQKVEKSLEEERLEKESGRLKLGAKEFGTSVEMYDYFYNFLHFWPPNISMNKVKVKLLAQSFLSS